MQHRKIYENTHSITLLTHMQKLTGVKNKMFHYVWKIKTYFNAKFKNICSVNFLLDLFKSISYLSFSIKLN